MGRLAGKVAIVTGGTSGIGEATVKLFVEEGAKVIIFARNMEKGYRLQKELGNNTLFIKGDVTIEDDIIEAIETVEEKWGKLDIMFNNAGISGPRGPIDTISEQGFNNAVDVLIKGVFFGIKHAARVMKPQRSGSIINCSSVAGLTVTPDESIYATCKAAVNHLTRYTASELGEYGIRVNSVCPGAIVTPMWFGGETPSEDDVRRLCDYGDSILPFGGFGFPIDIAYAVLWLASDEARFVSGHYLVVDGGASIGWPRFSMDKVSKELGELFK
ncbi:glucose 1-dehydrogenase [Candidatus Bathyarchaeota archaeon]|nr:glucose 1-dehydrogenase [Candidatus Bathyarchaeota archaeon]